MMCKEIITMRDFDVCTVHLVRFIVQTNICTTYIQGVPGGKDNILGGHSIGHSKQKTLYEYVSYS
jgi:hypothetical protein